MKSYRMNKPSLIFIVIAVHFNVCTANVLPKMEVALSGAMILAGIDQCCSISNNLSRPIDSSPMPIKVREWVKQELSKFCIPQADTIPLLCDERVGYWAVVNDRAIVCSPEVAKKLEVALSHKNEEHDRFIALSQINLKHEMKHYLSGDSQRFAHAIGFVPTAIQAGYFIFKYGMKKIVQNDKFLDSVTPLQVFTKACSTAIMSVAGIVLFRRYCEWEADKFAYERAESLLQIQECCKEFQKLNDIVEKYCISRNKLFSFLPKKCLNVIMRLIYFYQDPFHPYPYDRIVMGKKYLKRWNARPIVKNEKSVDIDTLVATLISHSKES